MQFSSVNNHSTSTVIEGYCYVSLHVAILVHVFLTTKGALPTTSMSFTVISCFAHSSRMKTHEFDKAALSEVSSLDNLPDDKLLKLVCYMRE